MGDTVTEVLIEQKTLVEERFQTFFNLNDPQGARCDWGKIE